MKKSLLALAVAAALPAVAQAQSSVTLYGVVDGGFTYNGTTKRMSYANAGVHGVPRIGITGREPIGNSGLAAIFQVETGFNSGREGVTLLGNRGGFVGLDTSMGAVFLGSSVLSPSFWALNEVDPSASSNYTLNLYGGPARLDNSINYRGTFGGLTIRAAHVSNNDVFGDTTATPATVPPTAGYPLGGTDLSAIWKLGSLTLAGSYSMVNSVSQSGYVLGANYDLKFAKVFASYVDSDINYIAATSVGKTMRLGVNVPVGALLATAEYRRFDPIAAGPNVNTVLVAGVYSLSNRTTLNAYASKPNNAKVTAGVGVRHNF